MGAQTIVRYAHFEANVTKSLQNTTQSEWYALLRAQYGSQLLDTFVNSEMSVTNDE